MKERIQNSRIQNPEWHTVGMEREPAKTFRDLVIWQRAHQLVLCVYRLTAGFPKNETFGLTSQLRRAAVSVAANIAEGFKRRGQGDKARFLNIAQASLEECRYYLILTDDLGYAETASSMALLEESSRCLEAYVKRILNSDF
jgi:four helix bundle protein